jgi:electron transport complex protein RnfC
MEEPVHKLWHFYGGLHLEPHKAPSTRTSLRAPPLAQQLVVPVHQHVGEPAEALVRPGEYVHKAQRIARANSYLSAPIHAPSSGTVVEVGERPIPHPSGLQSLCIIIETDGRNAWGGRRLAPIADYRSLDQAELRMRVRECGVVGLGGAAFPTSVKLNIRSRQRINTLVINGAECEPYISCDDMLMRERAGAILQGARIMQHTLRGPECVVVIEDDMPHALEAMREALGGEQAGGLRIVPVPAIYPTGGERQLIKVLTGKEVPADGLPADIGVLCHNVGTAYAVQRAVVHGEPLLSRIVTVTGQGVREPCNLEVPLGTPVSEVIAACGGYTDRVRHLIMGGPMMGVAMDSDEVPVIKATNCLLVAGPDEVAEPHLAMPCIRCGECVRVCPAQLLPQELYWQARAKDLDKVQDYHLFDCIECGCCAYACPSHIPLVHYYRYAKTEIWARERERQTADVARARHAFHLERLEREKRERAERLARKKAALRDKADTGQGPNKAPIHAALERVKARKAASQAKAPEATAKPHPSRRRSVARGRGGEAK